MKIEELFAVVVVAFFLFGGIILASYLDDKNKQTLACYELAKTNMNVTCEGMKRND